VHQLAVLIAGLERILKGAVRVLTLAVVVLLRRGLACGRKSRLSGRRRTGCLLKPCDVHNAQNLKLVSALHSKDFKSVT
jgi:hypothetical protein